MNLKKTTAHRTPILRFVSVSGTWGRLQRSLFTRNTELSVRRYIRNIRRRIFEMMWHLLNYQGRWPSSNTSSRFVYLREILNCPVGQLRLPDGDARVTVRARRPPFSRRSKSRYRFFFFNRFACFSSSVEYFFIKQNFEYFPIK